MHEAAIAQSILNIAGARLKATAGADAVLAIHIAVGEFRNVDPDSLQFAFDSLKVTSDATKYCLLRIEVLPAEAICRGEEAHLYHPDVDTSFRCPNCGNGISKIVRGEELDITKITLQSLVEMENTDYARNC